MTLFQKYRQQFKRFAMRTVCLLWVAIALWGTVWVPQAAADSVGVGSEKAAAILRERAANELDRMAGGDNKAFVESAADGSMGKTKSGIGRLVDDADASLDAAGNQLEGKTKRGLGQLKGKAEGIGSDIGDAAEDAVDAVKDLFD